MNTVYNRGEKQRLKEANHYKSVHERRVPTLRDDAVQQTRRMWSHVSGSQVAEQKSSLMVSKPNSQEPSKINIELEGTCSKVINYRLNVKLVVHSLARISELRTKLENLDGSMGSLPPAWRLFLSGWTDPVLMRSFTWAFGVTLPRRGLHTFFKSCSARRPY